MDEPFQAIDSNGVFLSSGVGARLGWCHGWLRFNLALSFYYLRPSLISFIYLWVAFFMVMIMLSIDIPRIRSCLGWISRKGFRGMRWRAYSTVMPRETVAFWIVMVMRNYQPFFFGERAKTFFMSTLARPYCQFSPVIGTNGFIFFCLESSWRVNIIWDIVT